MSEDFAMHQDEFESTSERLDSILDRLNALGQSASEMKIGPLGPVPNTTQGSTATALAQPDLVPPAIPTTEVAAAITFDEFTAPTVPDMPNEVSLETTSELVEPPVAGRPSEVVETVEHVQAFEANSAVEEAAVEEAVVEETEVVSEVIHVEAPVVDSIDNDLRSGEAFGLLEPVEMNDPIESVEAVEAPVPAPMSELAPPPFFDQDAAIELAPVSAPVDIAPSVELAPPAFIDHEVDIDLAPEPEILEPAAESTTPADVAGNGVIDPSLFDTEPTFDTEVAAENPPVPKAPTSIFGSSLGEQAAPSLPVATPADSDGGWVSFHDNQSTDSTLQEPDVVDAPAVSDGMSSAFGRGAFDSDPIIPEQPVNTEAPHPDNEIFNLDGFTTNSVFDQATIAEPSTSADPFGIASEVEQTLSEINDPMAVLDPLNHLEPDAQEAVAFANPLSAEAPPIDAPVVDASDLYETDEDLPLPDFTGVYEEDGSLLDENGMPLSVEKAKLSTFAARREELDKLRPSDDEQAAELAKAESSGGMSFAKQIALVAIFALAILVFFWLNDPAAIEDIQQGVDGVAGN